MSEKLYGTKPHFFVCNFTKICVDCQVPILRKTNKCKRLSNISFGWRVIISGSSQICEDYYSENYGAENQTEIHYAMAVKNNLYDALEYAGQVAEAAKSHRKEMKRKKEQEELSAEEDRKNQAQVNS